MAQIKAEVQKMNAKIASKKIKSFTKQKEVRDIVIPVPLLEKGKYLVVTIPAEAVRDILDKASGLPPKERVDFINGWIKDNIHMAIDEYVENGKKKFTVGTTAPKIKATPTKVFKPIPTSKTAAKVAKAAKLKAEKEKKFLSSGEAEKLIDELEVYGSWVKEYKISGYVTTFKHYKQLYEAGALTPGDKENFNIFKKEIDGVIGKIQEAEKKEALKPAAPLTAKPTVTKPSKPKITTGPAISKGPGALGKTKKPKKEEPKKKVKTIKIGVNSKGVEQNEKAKSKNKGFVLNLSGKGVDELKGIKLDIRFNITEKELKMSGGALKKVVDDLAKKVMKQLKETGLKDDYLVSMYYTFHLKREIKIQIKNTVLK